MSHIAAVMKDVKCVVLLMLIWLPVRMPAQSKDLLTCLVPETVSSERFKELLKTGPRSFYIDVNQLSSIDYIDSLLQLDFQSPLEIVDSSFRLVDSCLQFVRKGGDGGVSSYYAYTMGTVKDENGRDVIELFLHYKNIVEPDPKGQKTIGVSFYRLIGEQILHEPVLRLRTFRKQYEIPL